MRTPSFIVVCIALLLGLASVVNAQVVKKEVLPNGLTMLVKENHAAPVVAVRVYVKTGSIYEGQYLGAGISHLFEHTLGEGTAARNKAQIADEEQAIGGQTNAYTSKEVTAYHLATAAPYFERALALLADELQHASFPEAEVKTQQGVIHNEMNLDDDDPGRVLSDLFDRTAFRVHPVRFPIIGFRENFDRLTRDDIVNYYKTHYTPENSVLSIAGDVDAQQAIETAAKLFKDWQRRSANPPAIPDEPLQTSPRYAEVQKDISVTYMEMGWHSVPLQHPDLYPLDVLAQVMGGGESSRLVRRLRDESGLVTSITATDATPNYNAGMFSIEAVLSPQNQQRVTQAIWDEVGKLLTTGITEEELKRAQRQIETSFVFNNANVENQAEQMAYDEMATGDPNYSQHYVNRIKAVTVAQVAQAAQKYLTRDGVTTAVVRPRSTTTAVVNNVAPAVNPPQMETLSNGMRLIIRENHSSPTVAIVVSSLGGARLEPADKAGVSNLMAEMLTRGTRKRTAEQIATLVDQLGGTLEGFNGYNTWGLRSQWLAADWRKGLSLVQESLFTPAFPTTELERVRAQVIAQLQEQADDPTSASMLLLRQAFYGQHPYGRSSIGAIEAVKKISAQEVQNYWNHTLFPSTTVIAIYGDVNPNEVRRAVAYQFGTFRKSGKLPTPPTAPSVLGKLTMAENYKPGLAQTVQFFGFPSIDVRSADRYTLDVLDAALSGAELPGGRLHRRLRDNQLVYVVHAFNQPGIDAGMFTFYAASTKANQPQVRRIIEEDIQRVREAPVSAEELARAKSMMIAAHAINNQTNLSQAVDAASDELLGLGYNDTASYEAGINAVTAEDVQRAAKQYLRPENSALAIVGPAD